MDLDRADQQRFSGDGATILKGLDRDEVLGLRENDKFSFSHHHQLANEAAFRVPNLIHRSFSRKC